MMLARGRLVATSTPTYPSRYKGRDGVERQQGYAEHPQVDSGLGFTCDEGILNLALCLNAGKIKTMGSCQGPHGNWAVPRAWIRFYGETDEYLIRFCVELKDHLFALYGRDFRYECHIHVDNYCEPRDGSFANVTVPQEDVPKFIDAINYVMERR